MIEEEHSSNQRLCLIWIPGDELNMLKALLSINPRRLRRSCRRTSSAGAVVSTQERKSLFFGAHTLLRSLIGKDATLQITSKKKPPKWVVFRFLEAWR